ncbi:WD40 repeat domain-containing protein [Actinomadura monticuli]|uniref:WD40 repeat domain-containing protein n=1 Tax=Actinomadura monticuli TaxID=3097367 RepID=A0ABV4Q624_9ACTN
MPESVLAEPLAQGPFDGVAATAEGAPLAFTSQAARGANTGQLWDLAAGAALGPPIPGFPTDRAEWAFGVPAGSPTVAWTYRDRVHVHDLSTGHELALDGQPELLGLASHHGRAAVAAVFGPASDAEAVVWDAVTGERLAGFSLWLGHRAAVGRWLLHATPATGPLIGLPGDAAITLLDVERGEEIAVPPAADTVLTPSPDGLVLVQPAPSDLRVRGLDGDHLAILETPAPCDRAAAALVDDRLIVAASLRDDPGTLLAWDTETLSPSHRVTTPSPVNDLALAPDGTLLAATDDGLYTARLCG